MLVLTPSSKLDHFLEDIWRYRELFLILAWRDFSVRYKQTIIGITWSLVRPILTIAALTIIFGKIAQLPSDGAAPYAIMVFAGMLPWQLASNSLAEISNSLLTNSNLISKVYFPRLIIPAATVLTALVDFFISFVILLLVMVWYEFPPNWKFMLIPLFTALAMLISLGIGLWFSALNVKYRDFRQIVPFLLQFGLYITPVGFTSSAIPEQWRLLYSLNPMVGVIDGFRWCVLGEEATMYWPSLWISLAMAAFFLAIGLHQFRKMEQTFADII